MPKASTHIPSGQQAVGGCGHSSLKAGLNFLLLWMGLGQGWVRMSPMEWSAQSTAELIPAMLGAKGTLTGLPHYPTTAMHHIGPRPEWECQRKAKQDPSHWKCPSLQSNTWCHRPCRILKSLVQGCQMKYHLDITRRRSLKITTLNKPPGEGAHNFVHNADFEISVSFVSLGSAGKRTSHGLGAEDSGSPA